MPLFVGGPVVRKKQQPDKARTEMSAPYPAFSWKERFYNGFSHRKHQNHLFQVSICCFWKHPDFVHGRCRASEEYRRTGASAENRNLLRWCRIYSAKLINAKRNGVTEVTPYSPRKSGLLFFFCFTGTARKPGGFKHCLTLIPQLFPARQSPSYTLRLPMLKLDSGNRPEPEPYTVPSLL